MPALNELVPAVDDLLVFEPEEVGVLLLRALADQPSFHPGGFEGDLFSGSPPAYPHDRRDAVVEAVREAFAWLNGQALLIEADPLHPSGHRKISRRGRRLLSQAGGEEYKAATLLPRKMLHSKIRDSVYFNFQRGDYLTAVFCAFREVEIAVRAKSKLSEFGVDLMHKAFNATTGPLADLNVDEKERDGRRFLFAGAFQSCRNPHGHREIKVSADEAVHMLMLASYLLQLVDAAPDVVGG
jgi:uncharacterized protein (TIGR02391 family)